MEVLLLLALLLLFLLLMLQPRSQEFSLFQLFQDTSVASERSFGYFFIVSGGLNPHIRQNKNSILNLGIIGKACDFKGDQS